MAVLPAYLIALLGSMIHSAIAENQPSGSQIVFGYDQVFTALVAAAIAAPVSSIMTRRLHDIGLQAVWFMVPVVLAYWVVAVFWTSPEIKDTWIGPAINWTLLAFAAFLVLWPGQKGDNQFGPSARRYK